MPIPKIIIQSSKSPPESYIIDKIREKAPGWTYFHFVDETAKQFMRENPLPQFPYIIERFDNIPSGPHKADLFRYYYLFVKGGVFIDSDAMIEIEMDQIIKQNDFFTVISICVPNTVFQGFLGAAPHNQIIYESLLGAYMVHNDLLSAEYHILCKHMHTLIIKYMTKYRVELFSETPPHGNYLNIVDEHGRHILTHYFGLKTVPR